MTNERIPDPIELGEDSVERWAQHNMRTHEYRCSGCGQWKPIDDAHPSSPSPYALPICGECAFPDESSTHEPIERVQTEVKR